MPIVSVIITTYNRGEYIRDAIDSVLAQTFQDFELIVVDDGSIDNTKEVVEGYVKLYPDKIRYLYQSNRGQPSAKNLGIDVAKGDYIAHLDSDDYWLPKKLEVYLKYFRDNPDVAIMGGRMSVVDDGGAMISGKLKPESEPGKDFLSILEKGGVSTSSMMIRSHIARRYKGHEGLTKLEDLYVFANIAREHNMMVIDEILAVYRETKFNTQSDKIVSYADQIKFWREIRGLHGDLESVEEICKNKLASGYYLLAREHFNKRAFTECLNSLRAGLHNYRLLGKVFWKESDSIFQRLSKIIKPYVFCVVAGILSFWSKVIFNKNRNV